MSSFFLAAGVSFLRKLSFADTKASWSAWFGVGFAMALFAHDAELWEWPEELGTTDAQGN
jgi:hypothetical protein